MIFTGRSQCASLHAFCISSNYSAALFLLSSTCRITDLPFQDASLEGKEAISKLSLLCNYKEIWPAYTSQWFPHQRFSNRQKDPQAQFGIQHWIWAGCCLCSLLRVSSPLHTSDLLPLLMNNLMYAPHMQGSTGKAKQINPAPAPACNDTARVTRTKEIARQHFCHQHKQANLQAYREKLWQAHHSPSPNGFKPKRIQEQSGCLYKYC